YQVVLRGSERGVDYVKKHHQTQAMGSIDQFLELIGRAIGTIRGIRQHAVITPVSLTRKISDVHQLYRRDAQTSQGNQTSLYAQEAAAYADVQLIDYRFMPGSAAPFRVAPCITMRVDNHAAVMHIASLHPRGRIRHIEYLLAVGFAHAIVIL